jgi:AcrR family transcriptional regulator
MPANLEHLKKPTSSTRESAALSLRERKKRETRRRIYSAAFELFLEKGFDNTTVEEIAARADVGKGTVFNYFPHKTSFLAALADEWLDRLNEEMGPVEQLKGSTRESVERMIFFLADLSAANPELAHQALFESLRFMYDGQLENEESIRGFRNVTLRLLEKGQKNGELRTELEPHHGAALLEAAFHRTLVRWLREPGPVETLHDQISAKLDIIFDGMKPRNVADTTPPRKSGRRRT